MTNEESIAIGGRNCGKTYKIINELQQENTKLKAENERLKAESEQLNKYNSKLCMELTITIDKLCLAEKEIDRLK